MARFFGTRAAILSAARSPMKAIPWLVLTIAVVLVFCSGISLPHPAEPAEVMAFAGFSEDSELEMMEFAMEEGMDSYVEFIVRGSSEDIDPALAAADLMAPTTTGTGISQAPLLNFDYGELTNVRHAADTWVDSFGVPIRREYVRGSTSNGEEVIHVMAGTS